MLIGCPVFAGLGLVIYGLPVLLFMLSGGGSMSSFGSFANAFSIPAIVSLLLGLVCLFFAAIGYFVVLFKTSR